MDSKRTAVLLIGYQNDYFSAQGILHGALEDSSQVGVVLDKTLQLIDKCQQAGILLASTPIIFTPDYSELNDPIGILKLIKDNIVQVFYFSEPLTGEAFTHLIAGNAAPRGKGAAVLDRLSSY